MGVEVVAVSAPRTIADVVELIAAETGRNVTATELPDDRFGTMWRIEVGGYRWPRRVRRIRARNVGYAWKVLDWPMVLGTPMFGAGGGLSTTMRRRLGVPSRPARVVRSGGER